MNSNPSNTLADVGNSANTDGDEQILKVRKPYTITKQRERWSEEEHKKFLEALQLHGRAWRRIEEHIGTKTAVQIRSHAQKFFSKVVRESAADTAGNAAPIEIPPPRPKRKPTHPYPRKLGSGGLTIPKLGRSLSPVKSGYEQENGSPTSVLSRVGSDALGSLLSNEREPSVEDENKTTDDAPSKEEQVPCLKLFGKTVMLTNSHKQVPPGVRNVAEQIPKIPTTNFARSELGTWNPWSGGTFPMFYPLPSSTSFGDITNPAEASMIPLPWWGVCANLPQFSFARRETSRQVMNPPLAEASGDKDRLKECSGTGSNTASVSEGANDSPAIQSKRARSDPSARGFVPYKRCVVEKDDGAADNDDGQSVALCL